MLGGVVAAGWGEVIGLMGCTACKEGLRLWLRVVCVYVCVCVCVLDRV